MEKKKIISGDDAFTGLSDSLTIDQDGNLNHVFNDNTAMDIDVIVESPIGSVDEDVDQGIDNYDDVIFSIAHIDKSYSNE